MYTFKLIYTLAGRTQFFLVTASNFNDAYDIGRARLNVATDGCGVYVSIDVVARG